MTGAGVQLLVGGMARSGTTLVQRLLCELSGVWVVPETHFWRHARAFARQFEFPLAGDDAGEAVRWLLAQPSTDLLDVRPEDVVDRLPDGAALWDVFVALCRAIHPDDVAVLGEKTPDHVLWARPLLDAVPQLRVLGVVRDPRAVHRSHLDVPWGVKDVPTFSEKWVRHARNLRRLVARQPDRVRAVRLEDVTADPAAFQQRMGAWLTGSTATAPLDTAGLRLFDDTAEWWKKSSLGDVRAPDPVWRSELPTDTVRRIEAACGPEMAHWGYDTVEAPPVAPAQVLDGDGDLGVWAHLPLVRCAPTPDGGTALGSLLSRLRDLLTGRQT